MDDFDKEHGFLCHRRLPDGRLLTVVPLIGGRARLCIANDGVTYGYDDGW